MPNAIGHPCPMSLQHSLRPYQRYLPARLNTQPLRPASSAHTYKYRTYKYRTYEYRTYMHRTCTCGACHAVRVTPPALAFDVDAHPCVAAAHRSLSHAPRLRAVDAPAARPRVRNSSCGPRVHVYTHVKARVCIHACAHAHTHAHIHAQKHGYQLQ